MDLTDLECKRQQDSSGRRLSTDSQQSNHSSKMTFPLRSLDSGVNTASSDVSDCSLMSVEEPERSLAMALRDVHKLHSELDRLNKSEHWYKQELREQKLSRLTDLKRIYTQESKYLQENHKLQQECVRLYDKCHALESELENDHLKGPRKVVKFQNYKNLDSEENLQHFEIDQQKTVIKDQEHLIGVLRKQKQGLLEDLRLLSEDKDAKVLELQRLLAGMETDNSNIASKCKIYAEAQEQLQFNLQQKTSQLREFKETNTNLQKNLEDLKNQLRVQKDLVKYKEQRMEELQQNFRLNMEHELDLNEIHRLSVSWHEQIKAKTCEIIELKNKVNELEENINAIDELQIQNEEQQKKIEQISNSLEICQSELNNLKDTDVIKNQKLQDMQLNAERLIGEKEETQEELLRMQNEVGKLNEELRCTRDKYDIVERLCERTRFQLQLLELEQNKLKFRSAQDQQEILALRDKLRLYVEQTLQLSEKIIKLEQQLELVLAENSSLKEYHINIRKESKERNQTKNKAENLDSMPAVNDILQNFVEKNESLPLEVLQLNETIHQLPRKNSEESYKLYFEKLVNENENLRKKLFEITNKTKELELKEEIKEKLLKCKELEEILIKQQKDINKLRIQLLNADSRIYKMQRAINELSKNSDFNILTMERTQLKKALQTEIELKTEFEEQLTNERHSIEELQESLEMLKDHNNPKQSKAVQTDAIILNEPNEIVENNEVNELREKILQLELKLGTLVEEDAQKREERMQVLNKLMNLQDAKISNMQQNQKDWEEVLASLQTAQIMEEQTKHELELKRMELEHLNEVFAQQNEELRKLEGFAVALEFKRQQENKIIKQTFQQEIGVMQQQLNDSQREVGEQKKLNATLKEINERLRNDLNEDCTIELNDYKDDLFTLKSQLSKTIDEKKELSERFKEMELELKQLKDAKRDAVIMPEMEYDYESLDQAREMAISKSGVSEDHLRILTKVLESEYERKMQRYDHHIHSLLSNVKSLKYSLKLQEEQAAFLKLEQSRTAEELFEMQKNQRPLEEIRLKYEQSQQIIKELKVALEWERHKFESSDIGKSVLLEEPVHEVANLIDDYKKLIQQSAASSKRPKTSTVLDLIARSNQYVPSLHKLEANFEELRHDLKQLLSLYNNPHFISDVTAINVDSLNVPPSLMDELKAASDEF
uniref:Uncharacterized protein n=1 Tax=Glossina brevipalpis TaxID=37001 RepID=A0A1A9W4C2_9MUSC